MALKITFTDVGLAEIVNANNTGTGSVEITHIAFTETAFVPNKEMKALPDEIKRVSSIAGEVVAADTISVTAKDEGQDSYTMRGFGIFTQKGTLLAVYGQAEPIIEKASGSTMLLTIDAVLADIDAASLTFGDISFSNPPASLTTPGVVTLSNATDSTAQNQASTPRAVKAANDNANTRLAKNQNLADLTSPASARVNLGLGTSATLGNTALRTSASTTLLLQAAAMNDHRTSGDHDDRYPQRGNNLSDLPSPSQARRNLELGASATMGTTASRTSTSTSTVLQAKAMNDHCQSGDHDDRYGQLDANNMWDGSVQSFKGRFHIYASNEAYLRIDARTDGKYARHYLYSVDKDGVNSAYRQAWYGGSSYTDVTTTNAGVEFSKDLYVAGELVYHKGNLSPVDIAGNQTISGRKAFSDIIDLTPNSNARAMMPGRGSQAGRNLYLEYSTAGNSGFYERNENGSDGWRFRIDSNGKVVDEHLPDHLVRTSGNQTINNQITLDNSGYNGHLRLRRGSIGTDITLTTAGNGYLRFLPVGGVDRVEFGMSELRIEGQIAYHTGNIAEAYPHSHSINGWEQTPTGKIEQWGISPLVQPGAWATVNFATTFPNECYQVIPSYLNESARPTAGNPFNIGQRTRTGFRIFNGGDQVASYGYKAVGK